MYDELVKVLRGCVLSMPCDSCPYYDPNGPTEKCATLNIAAADAIEELQAAEKKFLANISALETENQHLKREREWMPVESPRDFNTVKSDLMRHLYLSCQKTDGEILWYGGTLEVLVEFLSILQRKAEEGE